MSMPAESKNAAPKIEPKAAEPKMYVIDTTAGPDTVDGTGRPVSGARTHELILDGAVRPFTFRQGVPNELPMAVALKFLKASSFRLVDKDGNVLEYSRPPKQPDELQAGETLKLAGDETVARYDELSTAALQQRVIEMPGGEKFAKNPSRTEMIVFIVKARALAAKANASRPEGAPDTFVPEPEFEDAA